jgi:hypothetical protein
METIVKNSNITEKNNLMTYSQIRKKVGEAWAFLENPVYENGILTSAKLLYYNSDKKKVLQQFKKYQNGNFALSFCGTIDRKQVYIL